MSLCVCARLCGVCAFPPTTVHLHNVCVCVVCVVCACVFVCVHACVYACMRASVSSDHPVPIHPLGCFLSEKLSQATLFSFFLLRHFALEHC